MHYSILILLFLQSVCSVEGQSFEGIFEEGYERLEFHADTVYYFIGTNGGLIYPIVGHGTYSVIDSFLVIENMGSVEVSSRANVFPGIWPSKPTDLIYADKGYTIFKIKQITNCSINCMLLSYDYELKGNAPKSLRKLYRDQNRIPYFKGRDRIYKKADC